VKYGEREKGKTERKNGKREIYNDEIECK